MEISKKEGGGRGEGGEKAGGERGENEERKKIERRKSGKKVGRGEEKKREECGIWRGVDGEEGEKRLWLVEEIAKRTLRREVRIRGAVKRRGKGKRWILIMEMEEVRGKEELLQKDAEIGREWRVGTG